MSASSPLPSSSSASNPVRSPAAIHRDIVELGKLLEQELDKHPEEKAIMERCEAEALEKGRYFIVATAVAGISIATWRTPAPRSRNSFGTPLNFIRFLPRAAGWTAVSLLMTSSLVAPSMDCNKHTIKNPASQAGLVVRHKLRTRDPLPTWLVKFDQDHPNDRLEGVTAAARSATLPFSSPQSSKSVRDRDLPDPEPLSASQSVAAVVDARQASSSSSLSSADVTDTRRRIPRDTNSSNSARPSSDRSGTDRKQSSASASSPSLSRDPNHKYKTFDDIRKERASGLPATSSTISSNNSDDRNTRGASPSSPSPSRSSSSSSASRGGVSTNSSNGTRKRVNEFGDEIIDV